MNQKLDLSRFAETTRFSDSELPPKSGGRSTASSADGQVSLLIYCRDGIQVVPLTEGQCIAIGRSAPADISIRDRSLSRQHASVTLKDGEVWVEDLQSTNGTKVNGKRIEKCKVQASEELAFGAVTASVNILKPFDRGHLDLENNDRFRLLLDSEISRARSFSRSVALLMLRSDKTKKSPVSRWFPRVRQHLRQFDHIALYSADIVEILVPETNLEQTRKLVAKLVAGKAPLACGVGIFPDHASSAEALVDVTLTALRQTTSQQPVSISDSNSVKSSSTDSVSHDNGPVIVSHAMQEIFKTVERLSSSVIPVLLLGETGTGKEVVARAIQKGGKREKFPMICVNCGGIPSQLVESTLFGYERGAFTGANQQSKGVFESADGGIILFDEIGELPLQAQAALLRVLETNRFTRVGSNKEIEVDVRIVAATHQDLETMCHDERFREDLFYRLNAMTITIPPLRERPEEIEPLAMSFVEQANQANDCQVKEIDQDAMQLLLSYSWPGNVRELRNAIARAVVIAENQQITHSDLPKRVRELAPQLGSGPTSRRMIQPTDLDGVIGNQLNGDNEINLKSELNWYEARLILKALNHTNWDRNRAASYLGLPVRTLSHKMQLHSIKKNN